MNKTLFINWEITLKMWNAIAGLNNNLHSVRKSRRFCKHIISSLSHSEKIRSCKSIKFQSKMPKTLLKEGEAFLSVRWSGYRHRLIKWSWIVPTQTLKNLCWLHLEWLACGFTEAHTSACWTFKIMLNLQCFDFFFDNTKLFLTWIQLSCNSTMKLTVTF